MFSARLALFILIFFTFFYLTYSIINDLIILNTIAIHNLFQYLHFIIHAVVTDMKFTIIKFVSNETLFTTSYNFDLLIFIFFTVHARMHTARISSNAHIVLFVFINGYILILSINPL